jgi:hypothetical protein
MIDIQYDGGGLTARLDKVAASCGETFGSFQT